MNIPLTIIGFIIIVIAAFVNFMPKFFVKRFINVDKIEVNPNYEFNDEEKAEFQNQTAIITVKKISLLILLAGIIIIFAASWDPEKMNQ
jgi:hypothetical protein